MQHSRKEVRIEGVVAKVSFRHSQHSVLAFSSVLIVPNDSWRSTRGCIDRNLASLQAAYNCNLVFMSGIFLPQTCTISAPPTRPWLGPRTGRRTRRSILSETHHLSMWRSISLRIRRQTYFYWVVAIHEKSFSHFMLAAQTSNPVRIGAYDVRQPF